MANKSQRGQYNQNKDVLAKSEMNARYFKAEYETMYYALEIEKLRPSYEAYLRENHPGIVSQVTSNQPEEPKKKGSSDIEEYLGEIEKPTQEDANTEG